MKKRKKKNGRKGFKPKLEEGLIVKLQELSVKPSSDRELIQSLLSWYLANHFLTEKQQRLAKALIAKSKTQKNDKPKKYHLYAIGDGESVKLGISTNVGKRLNSMQTGHPKKLSVLWKFFVGRERSPAYKAERKLHRHCKKYKLRGEWFESGCMTIVNQFTIRENRSAAIEQEEHDISLLESAPF